MRISSGYYEYDNGRFSIERMKKNEDSAGKWVLYFNGGEQEFNSKREATAGMELIKSQREESVDEDEIVNSGADYETSHYTNDFWR